MNARFANPNEKLSLKYTIGSYIAACGPVGLDSINYEISQQYIGADNITLAEIHKVLAELMKAGATEFYDGQWEIYNVTPQTIEYIEREENKFEPLFTEQQEILIRKLTYSLPEYLKELEPNKVKQALNNKEGRMKLREILGDLAKEAANWKELI